MNDEERALIKGALAWLGEGWAKVDGDHSGTGVARARWCLGRALEVDDAARAKCKAVADALGLEVER